MHADESSVSRFALLAMPEMFLFLANAERRPYSQAGITCSRQVFKADRHKLSGQAEEPVSLREEALQHDQGSNRKSLEKDRGSASQRRS